MEDETRNEVGGAFFRHRIAWLGAAIVAGVALYSGGWSYLAHRLDDDTQAFISEANTDGVRFACENETVRGYPFRLGINCDAVLYERPADGLSFSARSFRSAAQVYDPSFVIGELDGPAKIEAPGLVPLSVAWDMLRSSVRLSDPLPQRVSIEADSLKAAVTEGETELFFVEHAEAHMRPNGRDLDLAARLNGLKISDKYLAGSSLPSFSSNADLFIADGVEWVTESNLSLRGRSGEVRQFVISFGDGTSINATGKFHVDNQGKLDAEFKLSVSNLRRMAEILSDLMPEKRE